MDDDGDGSPDTYGLASQITVTMFENLIVQNGGSLLDASETHVAFDSPEGIGALQFMADLLVNDGTAVLSQGYEYQNEFLAGKVAMIEGSSVSLVFMEGKYSFEMGIAPLPAGKLDTQLVAGTDVVIFRTTPERERTAWAFVKWFTDTKQTARWSRLTGYRPVRKSAMDDPDLAAKLDGLPGLRAVYAQLDRAVPQPKARGWYAGRTILEREAIEPVLRGRMQPAEALRAAAAKANRELAGSGTR
jgi:ABC-type glycerol-3-phosphate transport system substrate-binding protein